MTRPSAPSSMPRASRARVERVVPPGNSLANGSLADPDGLAVVMCACDQQHDPTDTARLALSVPVVEATLDVIVHAFGLDHELQTGVPVCERARPKPLWSPGSTGTFIAPGPIVAEALTQPLEQTYLRLRRG